MTAYVGRLSRWLWRVAWSVSTVGWRNCFSPIRSTSAAGKSGGICLSTDQCLAALLPDYLAEPVAPFPPADSGVEPVHSAPPVLRADGKSTRSRSLNPDRLRGRRRPISDSSRLGF